MLVTVAGPQPPQLNPIEAPGTGESQWRSWPALHALPELQVRDWASAVVVAAHPDDEVLGAGGIMALLAGAGARLRLVSVTDGEASDPGSDPAALAERRTAETAAALLALGAGAAEVIRLRLPDTGLAHCEGQIAAALRDLTAGFGVCLAPWERDAHADHEAVGRAARLTASQTLWYPVWMWHWARPADPRVPWAAAVRVALPPAIIARKQAAIGCFASQLEARQGGLGPVLPPGICAHFTRSQEVLFRC